MCPRTIGDGTVVGFFVVTVGRERVGDTSVLRLGEFFLDRIVETLSIVSSAAINLTFMMAGCMASAANLPDL